MRGQRRWVLGGVTDENESALAASAVGRRAAGAYGLLILTTFFLGCKRGISETGCGRNFADGVGEYAMARRRFGFSAVCYPISGFGLGRVARTLAILDDDGRVGACRL